MLSIFNECRLREDVGEREREEKEESGLRSSLHAIENESLESLKARSRAAMEELQRSKKELDEGISNGSVTFNKKW